MSVTVTVDISDELAQRMEAAVIRTGMDRDDCLRDIIEYGIEDIEDCVEAVEISKKIDAGEIKAVRMKEKEDQLVAMVD